MPLNRYAYSLGITGFFEFPTESARSLLPRHLEPVEPHHGTSVLAVTVFDFVESVVGAYRELILSVVVAPLVRSDTPLPKSALYPYLVATTTAASREHAMSAWHLPHWMEDVAIDFNTGPHRMTAVVSCDGAPVVELTVGEHSWEPIVHLYQCFMKEGSSSYVADVKIECEQSEHEEETGRLSLPEHPFHAALPVAEVAEVPFREVWMRDGLQTFENLVQIQA